MFDPNYAPLKEIGRRFGVSNHKVGRWLAELGLRTIGDKPSSEAFEAGLVKEAPVNRGTRPRKYFLWHIAKTVKLLEEAGHVQVQTVE